MEASSIEWMIGGYEWYKYISYISAPFMWWWDDRTTGTINLQDTLALSHGVFMSTSWEYFKHRWRWVCLSFDEIWNPPPVVLNLWRTHRERRASSTVKPNKIKSDIFPLTNTKPPIGILRNPFFIIRRSWLVERSRAQIEYTRHENFNCRNGWRSVKFVWCTFFPSHWRKA